MRLNCPLPEKHATPDDWVRLMKKYGSSACYCPVPVEADDLTVAAYVKAAQDADIVIAEVGAWSNPISPNPAEASTALEKCIASLAHAERVGARCCVNIAGSRNAEKWDGPHPENFSTDTFDLIVETTRKILDAVKPTRTSYTLETMPWIFPSSPDEYLALLKAIDRPGFAVHLDPVNMINTPARAYRTADFLRECFAKLGPYIKSCHGKDIILRQNLTVHLDECRPGTGMLDYGVFLRELSRLHPDTPLCLEHLPGEEYPIAAEYIRSVAHQQNLRFV